MLAMNTATDRIAQLRAALQGAGLFACIVPSADPHLSEYLPDHWQARRWLTGFTGSAGTLVVTVDEAALWVDSRYTEQAEAQLAGSGIAMMRLPAANGGGHVEWLADLAPRGSRIAIDGRTVSLGGLRRMRELLKPAGVSVATDVDLVSALWSDRAPLPAAPVYEHPIEYACQPRADKLAEVRSAMRAEGAQWHLISSLDDIAWLLNLRGADVDYNPVFLAHALVGLDSATLFVDPGKVDAALAKTLAADGVAIQGYEDVSGALACLPEKDVLLVDPARITAGQIEAAAFVTLAESLNPSQWLKSRKSDAQLAHVRRAMEEDGAALCEFFAWFEAAQGTEPISELTIDEKLTEMRARRARYVSPSFSTIAGFNANGAMPHYRAVPESYSMIEGDGLLLIDSGAQYLDGTTDITRVVPVGQVSAEQRRDYTLVLKGMIALSRASFPRGLHGGALDALARAPIWQGGADFGHGTGHGVGYFLNVHEGPQSISNRAPMGPQTGMQPGMITSNEPGLYRPGRWGVRIENLVLAVSDRDTEFGEFLRFETLTLCPIDTRCIDAASMRPDEIQWLDGYHAEVRRRLSPLLDGPALAWLQARTRPFEG